MTQRLRDYPLKTCVSIPKIGLYFTDCLLTLYYNLIAGQNDSPNVDIVDVRSLEIPYSIDKQHTTGNCTDL